MKQIYFLTYKYGHLFPALAWMGLFATLWLAGCSYMPVKRCAYQMEEQREAYQKAFDQNGAEWSRAFCVMLFRERAKYAYATGKKIIQVPDNCAVYLDTAPYNN